MTFCQPGTDCDESPGKQTADMSSQPRESDRENACEFLAIPIKVQNSDLKNRLSTVAEGMEAHGTIVSSQWISRELNRLPTIDSQGTPNSC